MDLINSKKLSILAITVLAAGVMAATPTLAATKTNTKAQNGNGAMAGQPPTGGKGDQKGAPTVMGEVTAISGTTITISGLAGGPSSSTAATTYTVDAAAATVVVNNVTSTVSAIAVGDKINVRGTVSGTSIAATEIRVGEMKGQSAGKKGDGTAPASSTMPAITGNGQPVVAGTVSAISDSTLTVTTQSGITYTIDASSAKIVKDQNTIAISNIAIGDYVVVQGVTNGTAVTASSVIDQGSNANATGNATSTAHKSSNGVFGFFGQIGKFFKSLFGF